MILPAAIGAVCNVIRGGVFSPWPYGKELNIAVFAAFSGFYVDYWWQVPLCAAAMWAGQALSWGEIIGDEGILGGNRKSHAIAIQRGMYWGGLIAIAMWSLWPLVAGVFFGISYEVGRFCAKVWPRINAWMFGEAMFGAILWGGCSVG